MRLKFGLINILILLGAATASAYIPPYWMIISRTADNHGKGVYEIDQDVVFQSAQEPLVVNEKWIIQGENNMRLEVTGRKQLKNLIRLTYVYQNGHRFFVDENGVTKSDHISADFFEPYFHFRYSKYIKPVLVAQDMAPSVSLHSEQEKFPLTKPVPPETFVRLTRVGGTTAWTFTAPAAKDILAPGLWIEQDQFVIRKLRLRSLVEIKADNYKTYSQELNLPRARTVTWSNNQVSISLNSVIPLKNPKQTKELLDHSQLNFGKNPGLARLLPEDALIREFYSRMR